MYTLIHWEMKLPILQKKKKKKCAKKEQFVTVLPSF